MKKISAALLGLLLIITSTFIKTSTASAAGFGVDDSMWLVNGITKSIVVDGDYTYIGGEFVAVAPPDSYTGNGVVLDSLNARRNEKFPKIDGLVSKAVPDSLGGWYIGGTFSLVGDYRRTGIAHIRGDGSVNETWNPNPNSSIGAIAITGDDIYVGGGFTIIDGQSRNYIAKLDKTTGTVDPSWNPNPNYPVGDILISGSDIYVAGYFSSIGGQLRNCIAKLNNTTGAADPTFNPNANNSVLSITMLDNYIYAGGFFSSIGGQARNRIAKLNTTTGAADLTWNPNASTYVYYVTNDETFIYAGGYFTAIGGQPRNRIARLDKTTGLADLTWDPNANDVVDNIAISGNDVYIGGYFTTLGGQSANRIAKLSKITGASDPSWNTNSDNVIDCITISGDKLFVGGFFKFIGEYYETMNHIARINNSTGEVDLSWNPNASASIVSVNAIAISDNYVYIGGSFTAVGGLTRNRLAKLDKTTGAVDPTWNPNASTSNSYVNAIVILGSDIYVGGNFTTIGGLTRRRIAKLNNTTGAANALWDPNATTSSSSVNVIAISGSDIYVGGSFTTIGGQTRNRVAKLNNTTGAADLTWNPNANNAVYSILISGSDIYVGGYFSTIGGQSRNRIAKLDNTTGISDPIFDPNATGAYPYLLNLAISGSDIYAGGYFSTIGGLARNSIAKLDSTAGVANPLWDPDARGAVYSILVSGNNIYVVGSFGSIGGRHVPHMARIYTDTEPPEAVINSFSDNITTVVFKGAATEYPGVITKVEFQIDGTDGIWIECTADDGAFDEAEEDLTCAYIGELDNGGHILYIKTTDDNGNVSTVENMFSYEFTLLPATGTNLNLFFISGILLIAAYFINAKCKVQNSKS